MGMPGRFWNVKLVWKFQGSGYTPLNFTCDPADHGGLTWQNPSRFCWGESTTKQLSVTFCPKLTPPASTPPRPNRALMPISTPLNTSVFVPKCDACVTSSSPCPNFSGLSSLSPQNRVPPPPGNRGATGAVIQNGSKSAGVTARLSAMTSVALGPLPKLRNQVRKYPTFSA